MKVNRKIFVGACFFALGLLETTQTTRGESQEEKHCRLELAQLKAEAAQFKKETTAHDARQASCITNQQIDGWNQEEYALRAKGKALMAKIQAHKARCHD